MPDCCNACRQSTHLQHIYITLDLFEPVDPPSFLRWRDPAMLSPVERNTAEALGLSTEYRGRDQSPEALRYFVDNPLPQTAIDRLRITAAVMGASLRNRVTTTIPVAEIKTWQDWIRPTGVIKALTNSATGTPPRVIRVDGDLVLLDGNHRVTAALMRGDPLIDVSLDSGEI